MMTLTWLDVVVVTMLTVAVSSVFWRFGVWLMYKAKKDV